MKNYLDADKLYDNKDYKNSFSIFLELAKAGDDSSMLRVASMYSSGEGITCDYNSALYWERKAIESGNKEANINIGITYRMIGDIIAAKKYFEKALNLGLDEAALELAKLYSVSDKEKDNVLKLLDIIHHSRLVCAHSKEEAMSLKSKILNQNS